MKLFVEPKIEIYSFEVKDVIAVSWWEDNETSIPGVPEIPGVGDNETPIG